MRETQATGLLVQHLSKALKRNLPLAGVALSIGLMMTTGAARAGGDDEDNRSISEKFVDGVKGYSKPPIWTPKGSTIASDLRWSCRQRSNYRPRGRPEPKRIRRTGRKIRMKKNARPPLQPGRRRCRPRRLPRSTSGAAGRSTRPERKLSFTDKVSNFFGGNKPEAAPFTGEPPREDLTQPPSGYQIPSPDYAYGVGVNKPLKKDSQDKDGKDNKETSNKQ